MNHRIRLYAPDLAGRRLFITVILLSVLTACNHPSVSVVPRCTVWGELGLGNGSFQRPRAIGVWRDEVYVVDTSGRVQVFTEKGDFVRKWVMPESENGTPTAIAFYDEGRVVIPDTHYSRILECTPDGEIIDQWGSYGTGPDEFIYPTGLARSSDGTVYISEYGMDAERVHVFDADGKFARQWGAHGDAPGQFNRSMAIAVDDEGTIYVVDSTNHRVQCFDGQGNLVNTIGGIGAGPGQLKFPYDIALGPNGSVFVCEYGNHRISQFTRDGEFVISYGRPGRGPGEFNAPRGVAVSDTGVVFVADTDNNRIQRFEAEGLG